MARFYAVILVTVVSSFLVGCATNTGNRNINNPEWKGTSFRWYRNLDEGISKKGDIDYEFSKEGLERRYNPGAILVKFYKALFRIFSGTRDLTPSE